MSNLFTRIANRVLRPAAGLAPVRPARFEGEGGVPEPEPRMPRAAEALLPGAGGEAEGPAGAWPEMAERQVRAAGGPGDRSGAADRQPPAPRGRDEPSPPSPHSTAAVIDRPAPRREEEDEEPASPPPAAPPRLRPPPPEGWPPPHPLAAPLLGSEGPAPGEGRRDGPRTRAGPGAPGGELVPAALARPSVRAGILPMPAGSPADGPGVAAGAAAESVVHVTIGRLEVRAVEPARPAAPPRRALAAPSVSLDDYLRRRREGRR